MFLVIDEWSLLGPKRQKKPAMPHMSYLALFCAAAVTLREWEKFSKNKNNFAITDSGKIRDIKSNTK